MYSNATTALDDSSSRNILGDHALRCLREAFVQLGLGQLKDARLSAECASDYASAGGHSNLQRKAHELQVRVHGGLTAG